MNNSHRRQIKKKQVKKMSMRSQAYEWGESCTKRSNILPPKKHRRPPVAVTANREYDVFIGGIGNNITKPAETTATQFIVIEDIASTPYNGGAVQTVSTQPIISKPLM